LPYRVGSAAFVLLVLTLPAVRSAHAQPCVAKPIACGQILTATVGPGSCVNQETFPGVLFNAYEFSGVAGQQVTATISTSDNALLFAGLEINPSTGFSLSAVALALTQGASASLRAVLPASSSQWGFGVASLLPDLQPNLTPVNYSIALSCAGTTGCTNNGQTMCLVDGRFKVTTTFRTTTGESGSGQAVSLTDDTGYFWFFNASSVEAVVKLIDGCALGDHYWVFASGLTNVRVVLTVTDTKTGQTKTYTNPLGHTFEPVQDTAAFATCP
jgi:hypothetical protein